MAGVRCWSRASSRDVALHFPGRLVFPGLPVFGPSQVASIHGRGKLFMGYLVNTAEDLERCVACGVRAVLTDRPDLIGRAGAAPAEPDPG